MKDFDLMKTEYEFIKFVHIPAPERKTQVWRCENRRSSDCLGTVSWSCCWLQYIFMPADECEFSTGCMADIIHFIGQLMEARKSRPVKTKIVRDNLDPLEHEMCDLVNEDSEGLEGPEFGTIGD